MGIFILYALVLISGVLIFISVQQNNVKRKIVEAEKSLKYHKGRSEFYYDSAKKHFKAHELQLGKYEYHSEKVTECNDLIKSLDGKLIR